MHGWRGARWRDVVSAEWREAGAAATTSADPTSREADGGGGRQQPGVAQRPGGAGGPAVSVASAAPADPAVSEASAAPVTRCLAEPVAPAESAALEGRRSWRRRRPGGPADLVVPVASAVSAASVARADPVARAVRVAPEIVPGGGNGNRQRRSATTAATAAIHIVNNPVYGGGGAYGWNGGMAWAPAPYYWGGGFWGAMAIGVTSAAVYGAIVDEDTHVTYNSYEVQAGTPGETFLTSYQLTQTQCGPAGSRGRLRSGEQRRVRAAEQRRRRGLDTGSIRVTLDLIPTNGPPGCSSGP